MKLKIKMGISALLVTAALVCAISALAAEPKGNSGEESAASLTIAGEPSGEKYILREYEGYIGIFRPGYEKTPITVTDIEVRTLREADRALLRAGIFTTGRDEMMQLLEDFGS